MEGTRQMRYEKGVPLTEEERAGGGRGAGRKKKSTPEQRGEDINPTAHAGAFDQPIEFGNLQDPVKQIFAQALQTNPTTQALSGSQPANDQEATMKLARDMMEMWAQSQEPVSQTLTTQKMLQDPVGYANKMRSVPGFEWNNPEGAFYNRVKLSPEATLASQGNTATNQWAQQDGAKTGEGTPIDPEELKRLNEKTRLSRRTYM